MLARIALWALALLAAGCDAATCVDRDGDGLGEGCALGPDCDDANAARGEDCVAVPPPDCELAPTATGCPCVPSALTTCFPGDPALAGVGICTSGRAVCLNGHWGLCEGSVAPSFERCDGVDQDCDGESDEGVRSPCGGCDPSCAGGVWGDPFESAEGDLALTAPGALTLRRVEVESATIWVPNAAEGTVSRIDAASALETARYATGAGEGLEPSRVAVDWNGDAWVANRAFGLTSSVIRVAGDASRCVDGDGGGLATSSGPSDVRPFGEDECVLAAIEVGGPGEVARSMAIDGDRGLDGASGGDAWVGLHDGHAVVEIDGLSGAVLRRIELPGFSPYMSAFDPWGMLWVGERDGRIARIDPSADPIEPEFIEVPHPCWLLYALAIDPEGRLAMTGFACDQVSVYEPWSQRWQTVRTAASPRGASIAGERLYVAHTQGVFSELSLSPLAVRRVIALDALGVTPVESIGSAVDTLGYAWVVSSQGGGGGAGGSGVASRIDLASGSVDAQVSVGLAPHVQGDLSGSRRTGAPVPVGSATHVFEGCGVGEATAWARLHASFDLGTHGSIEIELRHAPSTDALAAASFARIVTFPGDARPVELDLPDGGVVEVRVTLRVEGAIGLPRLFGVGVEHACPGPD